MSRLIVAPAARTDLDGIWDYIGIENANPDAADRLLATIHDTFRLLSTQPLMGEKCQEFDHLVSGLRHFPVGTYIIYYTPLDDGVCVGHVAHGMMDQDELFREWLASGDFPTP